MQANQHHRTVNQEADDDHAGHIHARVTRRVQPVDDGGDGDQGHKEDAGRAAVAFKHFIRHPAAQQGARDPRVFIKKVGPGRFIQREVLNLFQVGRRPVKNAVAQQINKHVGDGDVPQQLVRQDVLHKDLLCGQLFFVLLAVVVRIIVFVLFDRRQAAGLRSIAHHREGENRQQDRAESRHIQRRVPVVKPRHPQQKQQRRDPAADVVRAVPYRNNTAALFLRPPVHHRTSARRPAHPLEPAAQEQQDEHHHNAGGRPGDEAHHQHHQRGKDQACR